jgi:ssRNA-specific RNase YbeY (16S rRNA maturation enzyme)
MATSKAKPTDATGRQREAAAAAAAEQQQQAAETMAMATAEKQNAINNDIIDATKPTQVATVVVDEPTIVAKGDETVTIRVVETIENMTFGAGNMYSFTAGQKYQVQRDLARHLEEKGYLAGVI